MFSIKRLLSFPMMQ